MARPPRFKRRPQRDNTRVNDRIRAPKVRVIISATSEQLGVVSTRDALMRARELGLDLVEVAPNADPPVCKIIDYGKYKYEQSKLKKERGKKTGGKVKEVKLRVRTDPHDYMIKMSRAETFLDAGNKLKVQLQFRGREMAHPEIGLELMQKVKVDLSSMAHIDMEPKLVGRAINMTLSPLAAHQRKRKFKKMDHEQLLEEDDFDDDHEEEGEGEEHHDELSASEPGNPAS